MNKKTKIVATVGPASESAEIIEKLIDSGVNIFRFNLKHNDFEWHKKVINRVRNIAKTNKKRVGIMVDFQGPEIRLETKDGLPLEIKKDETFWISNKLSADNKVIKANPGIVIKYIKKGEKLFVDDGNLELKVVGKDLKGIKVQAENDAVIKNRKSLNVISDELELPILADRDKVALARLDEINPDFIALSFVRSQKDIEVLKRLLLAIDPGVKVVAKIENARAIKNIKEIIKVTDVIMIARGDLGIEIPLEELAFWQKEIIDLCRVNSKPVIVATQMLQSMVTNNRPTRAEVTDVSNAVFDGTDALMLSEETSIGVNPVRVVKEMSDIANYCENSSIGRNLEIGPQTSTEVLVDAAVKIIKNNRDLKIGAVVIFTQSGNTARVFSKYRINLPVVAVTDNKDTFKGLLMSYGVRPFLKKFNKTYFKMPKGLINKLMKLEFISKGESILVMHGNNWMKSGSTTDISLVTV
jgi:pyruvate kinase